MEQLIDIFRFFAISQLLLIVVLIFRSSFLRLEKLIHGMLCLCVISYLIVDWNALDNAVVFYLFLIPTFGLPFCFLLFSKLMFDDNFELNRWVISAFVVFIALNLCIYLQSKFHFIYLSNSSEALLQLLRASMVIGLIIFAIIEAVRTKADDLILSRIKFRYWFVIITSMLIILTTITEIAFPNDDTPAFLEMLQKLFIFGLGFFFLVRTLKFKPAFFDVNEKKNPTAAQVEISNELVTQLRQQMESKKIYRTEGLSIGQLAKLLKVKEYKLRQTINQHLGFRNFNEFLNSYRIEEACSILSDPANKDMTILEMVYQLGYQSLAPFNKAFKKTTGLTPTEWRKRQLS